MGYGYLLFIITDQEEKEEEENEKGLLPFSESRANFVVINVCLNLN